MALESQDLPPAAYRNGYREGFHDGQSEGRSTGGTAAQAEGGSNYGKDGETPPPDAGHQDKDGGEDKPATREAHGKPIYKRPLVVMIVLAVVLALVIAAIVFWRHSRHHEKTDDAFIDGRASTVAAQTAGRVAALRVDDNQRVNAGDVLLEIDPRDNDARAQQARAQLADAQSQLDAANAQVEVRRAAVLQAAAETRQAETQSTQAAQDAARFKVVDPNAVPKQQADTAESAAAAARAALDAARSTERSMRAQVGATEAQVRTAEAGVQAARAAVAAAELQVSYTRVVAPTAGRVTRRQVEAGNVVSLGQPLMAIVSESLWVTANFKETQLTRMQPGQAVEITVDAFPDVHFRGHVDSIQRGTGAFFSLLPAENATGNYVKVVQRVPVKIVFDDDAFKRYAIGPGMSVSPDVDIP
jgi:membrane fusion protein (multidrug efflux system)